MTGGEEQAARDALIEYVGWVERLLRGLITEERRVPRGEGGEWLPLVAPEAQQALRLAWSQFEADFHDRRPQWLIEKAPRQNLIDHGLYGAQLNAKLRLVMVLARRVEALFAAIDQSAPAPLAAETWPRTVTPAVAVQEARPRRGGILRGLKDLIGGVDVFLDSVIEATGIGGAIREIKELFGMSIDEA